MIEETINLADQIRDRRIRAFRWLVLFRDFPKDCEQRFYGKSMVTEAITLFTKGRAQLLFDGEPQEDRVPGTFSGDYVPDDSWEGKQFRLIHLEPTTRVCIPLTLNRKDLPTVTKIELNDGETREFSVGFRGLVCLGSLTIGSRMFPEETSFRVVDSAKTGQSSGRTIILKFPDA
jgi:hypothetical protein